MENNSNFLCQTAWSCNTETDTKKNWARTEARQANLPWGRSSAHSKVISNWNGLRNGDGLSKTVTFTIFTSAIVTFLDKRAIDINSVQVVGANNVPSCQSSKAHAQMLVCLSFWLIYPPLPLLACKIKRKAGFGGKSLWKKRMLNKTLVLTNVR